MSEKQFYMEDGVLKDGATGEAVSLYRIDDLLNEQQDKITELEKNFEDLVNWSSEISKRNVLLDEKIGRLQQENKELKNKLNNDL